MKRPQTTFHAHTMRESKIIRSKKSKFIVVSTSLAAHFFLCQYFIETTTTDIDVFASLVAISVSNPDFPKPETRFFGYFLLPETCFLFNHQTRILKKTRFAVAFKY